MKRQELDDLIIEAVCDSCYTISDVWRKIERDGRKVSYSGLWKRINEVDLLTYMKSEKEKRAAELVREAYICGCKKIKSIIDYAKRKGENLNRDRVRKILIKEGRITKDSRKELRAKIAGEIAGILQEYVLRRAKNEDIALYYAFLYRLKKYTRLSFRESYERIKDISFGFKEAELAEKWGVTKQAVSEFRIKYGFRRRCKKLLT